jgi:hypothetical protein
MDRRRTVISLALFVRHVIFASPLQVFLSGFVAFVMDQRHDCMLKR